MGLENLKSVFSNIEPMNKTNLADMVSQRTEGWPGPVNYMPDKNAKGFTLYQPLKVSQFSRPMHSQFNNFSLLGTVNYFENNHALGFSPFMKSSQFIKPIKSEFSSGHPGPVNFFKNLHAKGFTLNFTDKHNTQFHKPILSIFDDINNVDFFDSPIKGFTDHFNTREQSQLAPGGDINNMIPPQQMIDTFGEIGHPVDYFDNEYANGFTRYFNTSQYKLSNQDPWVNPNLKNPYYQDGQINVKNLFTYPFQTQMTGNELSDDLDKTYNTQNYDPRPVSPNRPYIQKNPYKGSRFDEPIGGLFNDVEHTSENEDKYSTVWTEINKPKLIDIAHDGNLAQFGNPQVQGVGYPKIVPSIEEFYSQVGEIPGRYSNPGGEIDDDGNTDLNLNNWINGGGFPEIPHISELNYSPNIQGMNTSANTIQFNGSEENPVRTVQVDAGTVTGNTILDIYEEHGDKFDVLSDEIANQWGFSRISLFDGVPGSNWKVVFESNDFGGYGQGSMYYVSNPNGPHAGSVIAASFTLDTYGALQSTIKNEEWKKGFEKFNSIFKLPPLVFEAQLDIKKYEDKAKDWVSKKLFPKYDGDPKAWLDAKTSDYASKHPHTYVGQMINKQKEKAATARSAAVEKAMQKRWSLSQYKMNYIDGDPYTLAGIQQGDILASFEGKTHFGILTNKDGTRNKVAREQFVAEISKKDKKDPKKFNKEEKSFDILNQTNQSTNETTEMQTNNVDLTDPKFGMPFYFKDMRDNSYVFFRAYLEGITENLIPTWTPQNYIGRSEPVYIYERAERDLAFGLKLFAQNQAELKAIYTKLNKLTSMVYPEYKTDPQFGTLMKSNFEKGYDKVRMKPPLMKLRFGDLWGGTNHELTGFIKSLTYSIPDNSPWAGETLVGELGVPTGDHHAEARVPKFIMANITYQVIHDTPPNSETQFYGYTGVNEEAIYSMFGPDTKESPMKASVDVGTTDHTINSQNAWKAVNENDQDPFAPKDDLVTITSLGGFD
tara:strand:- start:6449 stop:9436 length:2988 start_codon:yes stop_codon:yes gene_type:complete